MLKKNDGFGDFDLQQAMRLANSDAGQQLLHLLQNTQGEKLSSAMDQAAAGNYNEMKKTMQELLSSQEAQQLLNKMRE